MPFYLCAMSRYAMSESLFEKNDVINEYGFGLYVCKNIFT